MNMSKLGKPLDIICIILRINTDHNICIMQLYQILEEDKIHHKLVFLENIYYYI